MPTAEKAKKAGSLSLERQCAQLVMPDYRFDEPDPRRIVRLVKAGVGSVCFFYGNLRELPAIVNAIQDAAEIPVLIASDYENGVAMQVQGSTALPTNMAVGASRSEEMAYLKGKVTAVEAVALGVPWILAPVVDLQSNPLNPIINTRSFGDDPALATKMARAFIRGVHDAGGLTCAKHFPGHGDVSVDSHLELPTVDLRDSQVHPYRELRDEVDSVMTGHLLVKALDPKLPASLSRAVTQGLLREKLGFKGLICTDALMMGGVTRTVPEPEALVHAMNAGADLLTYPVDSEKAIALLVKAVRSKKISAKRIRESVDRLFALRKRVKIGRVDIERMKKIVGCEEHREAALRIARAAVTKVKDDKSLLPLSGKAGFVQFTDESCRGDLTLFRKELSKHVKLEDAVKAGRPCVVAVFFRQRAFAGKTGMDEKQAEQIRAIAKRVPTVVVAFGSPYVLRQFPEVSSYVCTYSEDPGSQTAAALALAGKIRCEGRLPVRLGV